MSRYCIADIDKAINKKPVGVDKALQKVCKHITTTIDPHFDIDKFMEWVNSGDDKAFVLNGNRYYWQ